MEIRPLQHADETLWNNFCLENKEAWFWQTTHFLRYQEAYRPALKTHPRHLLCFRDSKIIAICPLALETYESPDGVYKGFTTGGSALPGPVMADHLHVSDRERVQRALFEEIDRLASAEGVSKVILRSSLLTPKYLQPDAAPENEFSRFGYLDASIHSQVLDIQDGLQKIWANFRKSYHSPIRRAEEAFEFRLYDRDTITPDIFDSYKNLHHKAAGRVVRSPETFQRMYDWIVNGYGFLGLAVQNDVVCACSLIILYKNQAYYGSACNDPELEKEWALSHFLQWKVIQELHRREISHYELGWQFFGPQMAYLPTHDEVQISFFKRGFGGRLLPLYWARKYYDRDLFLKEYTQFVEGIADSLAVPVPQT